MTIKERLNVIKDEIIGRYLGGESTVSLGKAFGCSGAAIFSSLRDQWGVEIRQTKKSEANKEKILNLHHLGLSAYKIGKELGLSCETACKVIKSAGFDISSRQRKREDPLFNHKEEIIAMYQSGIGTFKIGKKFGCQDSSINKCLNGWGINIRAHHRCPVNHHFFDVIDTEDKAYVLGFWLADGCNQPQVPEVKISLTDRDAIESIAKAMEFTGRIYEVQSKRQNCKTRYCISIGSRVMSDAMTNIGCVRNKTYIGGFPNNSIVPEHLMKHLVRGLSDGDGCITYNKNWRNSWSSRIAGNEMVCHGLSALIEEHLGFSGCVCPIKKGPKHTTWGFSISGSRQLKAYLDWLYQDATIFLQRKFDKYNEFLRCISS